MNKVLNNALALLLIFSMTFMGGLPLKAQENQDDKSEGVAFHKGSWDEALEKSKEEGKPIFVDAYASWCGPCKWMTRNVFTDDKVGDYYNKHFVNVKLDMEKGEGRNFARKYGVSAYPTLLYLNSDGKVVHKVRGAKRVEGFIKEGKKANAHFD